MYIAQGAQLCDLEGWDEGVGCMGGRLKRERIYVYI